MSENSNTFQVSLEGERSSVPTYNEFETELMSTQDHVLVVGDYLRKPLVSLSAIPGFDLIKQNLKEDLDVEVGNALQLHASSYILSGRNCFIIGPASNKAGKSLSYTIPIVSKLRHEERNGTLMPGGGPVALIVCGTHKSGLKTEEALRWLTQDSEIGVDLVERKEPETKEAGRSHDLRSWSSLEKQCEIMVATAECAAAVLDDPKSWFSFDRLQYLVFDDAQILFKYRWDQLKTILNAFKTYVDKIGHRKCLCQTVVCGSQWGPEMEISFADLSDNPVLMISSPVQAIRYGRFGIQVVEVSAETKFECLKAILERHDEVRRVLVVAADWKTLEELREQTNKEDLEISFLAGEGYIGAATSSARRKWKESQEKVIICTTDANLRELHVKDTSLLIHYDIPEDDLRAFAVRFSSMWNVVEDRMRNRKQRKTKEATLSYVLLDNSLSEKNSIVWKLHNLGAAVPAEMLEKAQKAREDCLDRYSLCEGFISAGTCTELDVMECSYRHHFVPQDFVEQPVLPLTGQVELFITEVKNPNVFTAKILRFINRDALASNEHSVVDFGAEASRRHDILKEAAVSGEIRNGPSSVRPGTKVVVALRDKEDYRYVYTRGEIQEVVTRTAAGLPKSVQVKCLDVGLSKIVRVDDIFAIPPDMISLPPCSVTVVLANTAPPFGEKKFRLYHVSKAKDHFKLDPVFQAEIALSMGHTIWVRRLVKMKKSSLGKVVEDWDATVNLCQRNILQRNRAHMEILYKSCEQAGFSCEVYRITKKLSWTEDVDFRLDYYQLNEPYQWAHLPINNEAKSGVVSTTAAPKFIDQNSNIYVSIAEFELLAEKLEDELTSDVTRQKANKDWNADGTLESYYQNGLVVAALDEDNTYRRGLILCRDKQDGDEKNFAFHVLFVDLGVDAWLDTNSIFPIPKKLVSRLPFQAIKLKLLHIKPHRPQSPRDRLHLYIIDILLSKDVPDDVEVITLRKLEPDGKWGPNAYEAFVFGADAELGEVLVGKKMAEFTDNGLQRVQAVKEKLLEKFRSRIKDLEDDNQAEVEDDGFDSDEFDFDLGPTYEDLIRKFQDSKVSGEKLDQKQKAIKMNDPETESSDEVKVGKNSAISDTSARPLEISECVNGLPAQKCDGMKKPNVLWLQNSSSVFIRVLVPDVSEYKCHLENKTEIKFETSVPPNYGFSLKLSKRVESGFEVRLLGQYTQIKLKKRLIGVRWEVLTPTTGLRWLKPELDFEVEDDEDNPSKVIETIPVDHEAMLDEQDDDDEDEDAVYEVHQEEDQLIE